MNGTQADSNGVYLTSGICHEFNNLLMLMQGTAEALTSRTDEGHEKALLNGILDACERGAGFSSRIGSCLAASRLEPKSSHVEPAIEATIRRLPESLRGNASIKSSIPAQLSAVRAHPTGLQSALFELCVNALEAKPKGGEIRLEARNVSGQLCALGRDCVRITVADNGPGLNEEQLANAFRPFFSTKQSGERRGLGLDIVQRFVVASGGTVAISGSAEGGTCVTLDLPCGESSRTKQGTRSGGRVLVVEENRTLRQLVARMLRMLGYQPIEAEDSLEAIAALLDSHNPLSLLLTDVALPGKISGYAVAAKARSIDPELPIIYCSSGAFEVSDSDAPSAPVLYKPFAIVDLDNAVEQAMRTTDDGTFGWEPQT